MIFDSNNEAGRCHDIWKTLSNYCVIICAFTDIV